MSGGPIFHPDAWWSMRSILAYAESRGLQGDLYIQREDFPRAVRLFARGHSRRKAGEVMDYFSKPPKLAEVGEDHILYRHFDTAGVLLYVGVSLSAFSRLRAHRYRSSWFRRVVRIELEHFKTRAESLAAESRAITQERPLYNRV